MNLSIRQYLFGVGILVVLGIIAFVLSDVHKRYSLTDTATSTDSVQLGVKTYHSKKYGFEFTYPSDFFLLTSEFVPDPNDSTALIPEEEIRNLNDGVVERDGRDARYLSVIVLRFDELTSLSEARKFCANNEDFNPDVSGHCELAPVFREEVLQEQQALEEGAIGDKIPDIRRGNTSIAPGTDLNTKLYGGTIVEIGGIRGIRTLSFDSSGGLWSAEFSTYDKHGNRISLSVPLYLNNDEYPAEGFVADDIKTLSEDDPRNKAFDDIVSSFKLL